jgi:antirestriction protein ArdC
MTEKQDVYTRVTRKIIADLERALTWLQPWQAGHQAGPVSRPLRASGTPYRGVNVLMLWASAMESGYSNPLWLTYRQANELGGQVRKGEKGTLVVYADTFTRTEIDTNGEANAVEIPFMKGYTVFNAEQVDGARALLRHPSARLPGYAPSGRRRPFFAATGAQLSTAEPWPFTAPSHDLVQMPAFQSFRDAESYYATPRP